VFPLQQSTALAAGPQGPTTNFTSGENRFPSLTIDPDGSAWVSTWSGLVRWKDHRTQTLTSRNGLPCDEVVSAIRDNRATLRLYTKCGFIGIADSELEKWWRQPDRVVRTQVLDVFGGAVLPQGPRRIQPAVAKSPDGRLWFVNGTVLQMIDPSALRRNRVPPPVYVEECVPIGRTTPLTGSFACRRVLGTSKSTTCLAGQPIGTERILPLPME
jgi:streptogramin lyase